MTLCRILLVQRGWVNIYIHPHTHTHTYIYIYIYRERERGRGILFTTVHDPYRFYFAKDARLSWCSNSIRHILCQYLTTCNISKNFASGDIYLGRHLKIKCYLRSWNVFINVQCKTIRSGKCLCRCQSILNKTDQT